VDTPVKNKLSGRPWSYSLSRMPHDAECNQSDKRRVPWLRHSGNFPGDSESKISGIVPCCRVQYTREKIFRSRGYRHFRRKEKIERQCGVEVFGPRVSGNIRQSCANSTGQAVLVGWRQQRVIAVKRSYDTTIRRVLLTIRRIKGTKCPIGGDEKFITRLYPVGRQINDSWAHVAVLDIIEPITTIVDRVLFKKCSLRRDGKRAYGNQICRNWTCQSDKSKKKHCDNSSQRTSPFGLCIPLN